jgi:hypothetical protein
MAALMPSQITKASVMVSAMETSDDTNRLPSLPWPNQAKASNPQLSSRNSRAMPPIAMLALPFNTGR